MAGSNTNLITSFNSSTILHFGVSPPGHLLTSSNVSILLLIYSLLPLCAYLNRLGLDLFLEYQMCHSGVLIPDKCPQLFYRLWDSE